MYPECQPLILDKTTYGICFMKLVPALVLGHEGKSVFLLYILYM